MGIATRFDLLLEGGSFRRIPQRVAQELPHGGDAILDFVGTRQKVIERLVESESGKPSRILDVGGVYWSFDDKGRIEERLMRVIGQRIEAGETVRRAETFVEATVCSALEWRGRNDRVEGRARQTRGR